ncbi:hypothetical protein N658DRAFT_488495 [Parathielavia hyrcaniae]|uniref:Rhodopsin domain-containing protein n=1 Tax=Parathielavia hyrcaniae TaxID=113614 RepID=A0AAN6PV02_9PEZI|nr:hypothetical protein N658DRAFT_488495 [Parathielavia hyrcaniae]
MILKPGVVRSESPASDEGGVSIFTETNIAIWVLTGASGAFLALRLACRHRFSKLWWDDAVLSLSWVLLLVAAAMLSRTISAGYDTDDAKRTFFLFHNTSNCLTTLATAWSKVAFAITLSRIVTNRYLRYFLRFVMVTANLIIIIAMISIWVPACVDPRRIWRPENTRCFDLLLLQYLGGITMVYGGVIDVMLALFPWFIIRKLLLDTREKLGLTFAMSLGAITGTVVIFRTFFTLRDVDNDYHTLVFMSIFNFLEPGITIIAQAIPMFRVLLVNVRKNSNAVRISSPSGAHRSGPTPIRTWSSKAHDNRCEPDEELFRVRVGPGGRIVEVETPDDSGSDKFDNTK